MEKSETLKRKISNFQTSTADPAMCRLVRDELHKALRSMSIDLGMV